MDIDFPANSPADHQEILNQQTDKDDPAGMIDEIADRSQTAGEIEDIHDEELKEAISDFVGLFVQQMFGAMRDTVPDDGLIDGGYAEDVFTEKLDEELAGRGAAQAQFKRLNETIYRQLSQ
ncbi:rod-binding protein [Halarsenatibacter silvermanii]|uniref:Rod binding protein n=1 Tax=Halarsenatibacter silvermanii TaxID=321763 RepID=A0A1G9ML48_9FIRM|nr:rod-binding protein [Halarsenatibacter silvermanii]SDL74939.1 Rod binding protein [Halarsenatibacter silvermanii]